MDPTLTLDSLLPLRAVTVTLMFTTPTRPRFHHQPALTAFLRRAVPDDDDAYDRLIRIDTPESGRTGYAAGDYYRFTVIALADGEALLGHLLGHLRGLPESAQGGDADMPFRDNWRLIALHDSFTEAGIETVDQLAPYDLDTLDQEAAVWADQPITHCRWLSPARLLLPKAQREHLKGEARFCRDADHLPGELLLERLHDALADLLRRRGAATSPRPSIAPLAVLDRHLFWVDQHYTDAAGKAHVMGGLAGQLRLDTRALSPAWWRLLVLGQYLGIGQRPAFGWGRYQLETPDGGFSYRRGLPATPLLLKAADADNLRAAWQHVSDSREQAEAERDDDADEAMDDAIATHNDDGDDDDGGDLIESLQTDLQALIDGSYRAPELHGYLIPKRDGSARALAIPPFRDRVLQRAVAQVLSPALDLLMAGRSHGYRRGHSRETARYDIQAAWREGYRWVYESDIDDFFDSVDHSRLRQRLQGLYDADPVIDAILAWMAAPVRYQGQRIDRPRGLPQGSPLSPLMANLILDDFDADLDAAGFRLVRFADDFVILCKSPERAQAAGEAARRSLAEHGLALNADKTRVVAMEEGFKYLGYLFVNDMALDISGPQDRPQTAPTPPPAWLAQLGAKPAQHIDRQAQLDARLETLLADRQRPYALGEREQFGTLLCITGAGALLSTRNRHLIVQREDTTLHDGPWSDLQAVVLFGNHHLTTPAMRAALQHQVPVHLANGMGRYQGTLWNGPGEHGPGLWLNQIARCNDPEQSLLAAVEVVAARLRHLKENLRRHPDWDSSPLDRAIAKVAASPDAATLRGLEGAATRAYYQGLSTVLPEEYGFEGRTRRPPTDPFNALLSLGYTLLYGYSDSILRAAGLYPWAGFYHQPRGQHAALASDLMEPFRHLVEAVALRLLRKHELKLDDFQTTTAGAVLLTTAARRRYLGALVERFETPLKARGATEAHSPLQHLYQQSLSLRRWINGDGHFHAWRVR